jgi:hypothetical protein
MIMELVDFSLKGSDLRFYLTFELHSKIEISN